MNDRPEKYVSICSHSQVALKALQAAKTMFPLVQQYQKAMNDISTHPSVELFWVPRHSWRSGNIIADEITREGTVHQFSLLDQNLPWGSLGS
jgi:ribonuclease HI